MARVFISYDRDDLSFVQQFAQTLISNGINIWWDLSSLQGGDIWTNAIPQAIEQCDLCIVVLTQNSIRSDWVQKEYTYALGRNKRVVPVLCQDCQIPFAFVNIHCIDLRGTNFSIGMTQLIQLARMGAVSNQQILQPAFSVNAAINPVVVSNVPIGLFKNIWLEHSIVWGMFYGMRIHTSAVISGQANNPCKAISHFFWPNGQPLIDFNTNPFFRTVDGFVSTAVDFIPLYPETHFQDIFMYIPYNELHLSPGIHQLAFRISFYDMTRNFFFGQSFSQTFTITQQ